MMSEQMQPLSGAGGQGVAETGPLVRLHFAPSRMLWRIGPAWVVVAGAVAAGAPLGNAASLLRLATAVILADLVWGTLRRLGGLALTVVLSLLLGTPALLISAAAVGLIFLTWALFRRDCCPSFCLALLDVGLPWALGAALVWPNVAGAARVWFVQMGMLAAAFTVLQWGLYRARFSAGRRLVALYSGQVMLLGALVLLRQPWAVAVAALLLAPPTWWVARRGEAEVVLVRALPWWWASMVAVAAIVR
jgi:hypothetical protein